MKHWGHLHCWMGSIVIMNSNFNGVCQILLGQLTPIAQSSSVPEIEPENIGLEAQEASPRDRHKYIIFTLTIPIISCLS